MLEMVISKITESPLVDETTDISNKEQLVFMIRRTDADLNVHEEFHSVHEEFLDMHEMKFTGAESITLTFKTVQLCLGIPIAKL